MSKTFLLSAILASAPCAWAQADTTPITPPLPSHRIQMISMAAPGPDHDRVVANAPYCADAVHETVQHLADGNRIVQRSASRQCRDAQGRTRQEVQGAARRIVYLRDPVANEAWVLDPEQKRATRIDSLRGMPMEIPHRPPGWEQRLSEWSREMREWAREMRDWGRDLGDRVRHRATGAAAPQPPERPQPPQPPQPPEPGSMPTAVRIVIDGVEMAGLPPPPPIGALPPTVAFHARLRAPRGPGVVTPLPAETIEGVRADGKRTTWTIEAGKIGNEKPITIVREVWSSPELMITLRSRDSDPLAGEEIFRVQNLVRGEPDAALFKVPADYRKVTPPVPPLPPAAPLPPRRP